MAKGRKLVNVTIGTAGHIDHGKTALVKLMTGCETDTLAEEKKRGVTINLGFAPCTIGGDRQVGIVDVPGHERFIRNMVAGATGMDLVLLVVAADDGVMPQTVEHMNIIELLGIRKGIVAVTKIDMVEKELAALAHEDVKEFLAGTAFKDAPVFPVSNVTGEGYAEFYKGLTEILDTVEPKSEDGLFRLPIERSFSAKGYGTIVTGIPESGSIRVGADAELLPGRKKTRIRNMQVYSEMADVGRAGECVAINITDVDKRDVTRGTALVEPGYFMPTHMVAAKIKLLANVPFPLKTHSTVRFHTGTTETMAKVVLLDKNVLEPGGEALVQFRLDDPVVTAAAAPYIIRYNTPVVTAGGGVILGTDKWRLKAKKQYIIDDLAEKESVLDDPERRVENFIRAKHRKPIPKKEILKGCTVATDALVSALVNLSAEGKIRKLSRQDAFIHVLNFEAEEERLVAELNEFYARDPLALGIDKIDLRGKLRADAALYEDLLSSLSDQGVVEVQGKLVSLASHEVELSAAQEKLVAKIEETLLADRFNPPPVETLCTKFGAKKKECENMLRLLAQRGTLVRLGDIYFHKKGVDEAVERLVAYLKENEGAGAKTLKELLDTSRKYAYALLDYIDGSGLTVRVKNLRYLKSGHKE